VEYRPSLADRLPPPLPPLPLATTRSAGGLPLDERQRHETNHKVSLHGTVALFLLECLLNFLWLRHARRECALFVIFLSCAGSLFLSNYQLHMLVTFVVYCGGGGVLKRMCSLTVCTFAGAQECGSSTRRS